MEGWSTRQEEYKCLRVVPEGHPQRTTHNQRPLLNGMLKDSIFLLEYGILNADIFCNLNSYQNSLHFA